MNDLQLVQEAKDDLSIDDVVKQMEEFFATTGTVQGIAGQGVQGIDGTTYTEGETEVQIQG